MSKLNALLRAVSQEEPHEHQQFLQSLFSLG